MERKRVSGPAGSAGKPRRKPKGGLETIVRDGHWHIAGTINVAGRSRRVRKTLGLPADRPKHEAEALRVAFENEILQQAVYGVRPTVSFAYAALKRLEYIRPSPGEIKISQLLGAHFGPKTVAEIDAGAVHDYLERHHGGHKPSTANRYLNTLKAVLSFAARMGWLETVPHVERPKAQRQKADKWLYAEEIDLLFDHLAPHARPIVALLACQGMRVAEAVYLNVEDFILAEGRERVFLHQTKNGERPSKPLHPFAAREIRAAIDGRQAGPAFLTDKGEPYAARKLGGGQIKTAWRGARARTVARMLEMAAGAEAAGCARDAELLCKRAEIVGKATPHWLRHSFASHLIMAGHSILTVMEAGNWKTARLVHETYGHLAPGHLREAITALPFGRNLTRDTVAVKKKTKKSKLCK